MGLILDSSLFIADEREQFSVALWLRNRRPEPVAVSSISFSELWFGIEIDEEPARVRRRRRWLQKALRRVEVVPFDGAIARVHSRIWARLTKIGQPVGPHDLIVAATALRRRWAVATFNAAEFRHVRGLIVVSP